QKVRNTQRSLSRAHKRLKTEAENNAASAAADRKEFDAKISELQEEISGVRKQLRNRKDYQCKLSSDRKVLKAENAELQVQVAELSKDLASALERVEEAELLLALSDGEDSKQLNGKP
ncbi:MAG: hypothetical protein ACK559_00595, partial [bacterium]